MNTQENPIIIVNEQWFKYIQELMDMVLKGYGMNAYTTVALILQTAKNYWTFIIEKETEIKKQLEWEKNKESK